MGKLIYMSLMSLDGYMEDAHGNFDWAAPDDEVHQFVNDLTRPIVTHLCGQRTYQVMTYWDTAATDDNAEPISADFARLWQAADKLVFSETLTEVADTKARIINGFRPDEVREIKASTQGDLSIGGAALAAHAIRAGLVDEYQLFANPVIVGGGKRVLPDGARLDLTLVETKQFANGTVFSRYVPRPAG